MVLFEAVIKVCRHDFFLGGRLTPDFWHGKRLMQLDLMVGAQGPAVADFDIEMKSDLGLSNLPRPRKITSLVDFGIPGTVKRLVLEECPISSTIGINNRKLR